MLKRGSGILLHISSLPSDFGVGDVGPTAYAFVDFCARTKQRYWQILPLNLTDGMYGNSPYSSISAFAAETLFVSPEQMVSDGWIGRQALDAAPVFDTAKVDYKKAREFKETLFQEAYLKLLESKHNIKPFKKFCQDNQSWLDDFALFVVLKDHFESRPWVEWPVEYRDRDEGTLAAFVSQNTREINYVKFLQYLFFSQWGSLKKYCASKKIKLVGDIPIYVNDDSVDVWTNPKFYKLRDDKRPEFVAGVPPDYFSQTGQRWGNPVYNWDVLKQDRYDWWIRRLKQNFALVDIVRIDHFRGLVQYWEIPSAEATAVNGTWVDVPSDDFLTTLKAKFPSMPIIAEDLGIITPDVTETMDRYKFPGMRILMFAFGGNLDDHPYIPNNYVKNCVAYTGTHDNNTVHGWYANDSTDTEKENVKKYFGEKVSIKQLHWVFIESLMKSVANVVVTPLQDILGLGGGCRMNTPSTVGDNWQWRLDPKLLKADIVKKLSMVVETTKRGA